jgi:hypothetical protein
MPEIGLEVRLAEFYVGVELSNDITDAAATQRD